MNTGSLSLILLCLNVDHTFVAYLMAAAEPIVLSLDVCRNADEVRQKLATTSYDAYLVDLTTTDISIITQIAEMRKKHEKKAPIVVISDPYRDERQLQLLKENNTIDTILQKPLFPQQVDKFLEDLSQRRLA